MNETCLLVVVLSFLLPSSAETSLKSVASSDDTSSTELPLLALTIDCLYS